ncbi:MAG: hypothetical protein IPH37_01250 [Burkholderiales bacterium]|nr:hypothetical protein [Burkholderiales bacterium]
MRGTSDEYQRILETLCPDGLAGRNRRFEKGPVRLLRDVCQRFLKLIEPASFAAVFNDTVLQQFCSTKAPLRMTVTPANPARPARRRSCAFPLAQEDLDFLRRFGVLRAEVTLDNDKPILATNAAATTCCKTTP